MSFTKQQQMANPSSDMLPETMQRGSISYEDGSETPGSSTSSIGGFLESKNPSFFDRRDEYMVESQYSIHQTKTHMGNSQGDIPEEYLKTESTQKQAPTKRMAAVQNSVPENTISTGFSTDIALPDFRSISPSSFFELKREFLKLSESYIVGFIAKLDTMRDAYENDDSERKARDLFASKKLGNSIGYEQYLYYSSILKSTNLIYRERIASAVFASRDTLNLFYFQVHFAYAMLRKSKT